MLSRCMEIKTGQIGRADGDMSDTIAQWIERMTINHEALGSIPKYQLSKGLRLKTQGSKVYNCQGRKSKESKDKHGFSSVNVLRKVGFPVYAGTSKASHMGEKNFK